MFKEDMHHTDNDDLETNNIMISNNNIDFLNNSDDENDLGTNTAGLKKDLVDGGNNGGIIVPQLGFKTIKEQSINVNEYISNE